MTGSDDRAAGFLVTNVVGGCVLVEQLSVDPGSVRQRPEAPRPRLAAGGPGVAALTLDDVRGCAVDAPYFARSRVLDDAGVTAGLRAIRRRESRERPGLLAAAA
jgi:hypothetical protein